MIVILFVQKSSSMDPAEFASGDPLDHRSGLREYSLANRPRTFYNRHVRR